MGYQLTLFGPRGADYAHHITTGPPIFLDDAASLQGKTTLLENQHFVAIQGSTRNDAEHHNILEPSTWINITQDGIQFGIVRFVYFKRHYLNGVYL